MDIKDKSRSELIEENGGLKNDSANIDKIQSDTSKLNFSDTSGILLNYVTESVILHTNDGIILDLNDSAARILGNSKTKLKGTNIFAYLDGTVKELRKEKTKEVIKSRKPVIFQEAIKGNYFDSTITPIEENNEVKKIVIFSKNITETVKALETIREADQRYKDIIEHLPYAIYIYFEDKFVYSNTAGLKLLGFENNDELYGKSVWDIVHKDYHGFISEKNSRVENGIDYIPFYENKLIRKDGKVISVEAFSIPFKIKDKIAIQVFAKDITDRKLAEETVRKLSRAVEQSSASIVITDLNGDIEYVNPKFCEVTGYSIEEVVGNNPRVLKSGEGTSDMYQNLWSTISQGKEWSGIFYNKRKDGSFFWESALISPIKNESGNITHYLGIKEDITEQKLKDEKLQSSLKEKELMLREIHHRVKNNLQIISSLLKLQATYITDPIALEYFRVSQDRVKSMALIHQQLYRSTDLSSIDFGDYLRNLTTHLFQAYGANEKNIVLNIEANNIFIGIDSAIPCGLLINELISNSLKHAFPGSKRGKILIKMESIGDNRFVLTVSDDGIGFPEDLDFKNTKSLGMQLVITLTEQIDATIELIRDKGTTFRISFSSINYKKRV